MNTLSASGIAPGALAVSSTCSRGSAKPSACARITTSTCGVDAVRVTVVNLKSRVSDKNNSVAVSASTSNSTRNSCPCSRFSALTCSVAVWPSSKVSPAARLTICNTTSPSRRVCRDGARSSGRCWSRGSDDANAASPSAIVTVQVPAGRLGEYRLAQAVSRFDYGTAAPGSPHSLPG